MSPSLTCELTELLNNQKNYSVKEMKVLIKDYRNKLTETESLNLNSLLS